MLLVSTWTNAKFENMAELFQRMHWKWIELWAAPPQYTATTYHYKKV